MNGATSMTLGRKQFGMMALTVLLASGIYLALDRWVGNNGLPDWLILSATELEELEPINILRALDVAKGKVSGAKGVASLLGLNDSTLSSRTKALKTQKPS